MSDHVTIGVPVYRGEEFLVETVDSILAQTHRNWQVVFSVDGPDERCERLCRRYIGDSRFRLTVQQERLGWVRNIGWLQDQAAGEFWCYLQQDDLIDPTYLEVLVAGARQSPDAAVVYCDMATFGERDTAFVQASVVGSPVERQVSLLTHHFAGVAFRGLTRVAALRSTGGGILENDVDNFAAEVVWMATMATAGDLIRLPVTRYRKRYHSAQVHREWLTWDLPTRKQAWIAHCHDLLHVAMSIPAQPSERWLLWRAAVGRLTASQATGYLPWADFTDGDREAMIDDLLRRITRLDVIDLPTLLNAEWDEVRRRSKEFGLRTG